MRRVFSLAALSILALSTTASAQRSGSMSTGLSPEIGMDAGVQFGMSSPSFTVVQIPLQRVRMGFFISPVMSIEPTFGLTSVSGGGISGTDYTIGAGLLYHFSPNRAANQFYVRPFLGIDGSSGGGSSSSTVSFGVGGGIKMPLQDRLSSRFEANFAHAGGQNGGSGSDAISLLAGLSFYLR
jgi:hypothetical protein